MHSSLTNTPSTPTVCPEIRGPVRMINKWLVNKSNSVTVGDHTSYSQFQFPCFSLLEQKYTLLYVYSLFFLTSAQKCFRGFSHLKLLSVSASFKVSVNSRSSTTISPRLHCSQQLWWGVTSRPSFILRSKKPQKLINQYQLLFHLLIWEK